MKPHHLLILGTLILGSIIALLHHHHSKTSPQANPTISTSSAPLYHELYRPAYHFSPPENWMNDPNGLTFIGGKYHLFYQYNPYNTIWGNMSWGHATSTDLVHWDNLPVAIPMYDNIQIFSGCNIIDVNNTSGFCTQEGGCLLAYYTMQTATEEEQGFAYSNDNGMTYTQFEGNPIISLGLTDFRDPKVIWYEPDSKWVMVTALATIYQLQLYSSTDLINWVQLSDFGPQGSTIGVWEDPDLYEIAVEGENTTVWVLAHSVDILSVEYYIGTFDGTKFVNTETKGLTLFYDYGFDFDEAATWNNEPKGRRLIIAWLDEGWYGGELPTKVWRGQQTLIREIKIRRYPEGLRAVTEPIEELQALRNTHYHYDNVTLNTTTSNITLGFNGTQLEIIAVFQYPNETDLPEEFGFKVFTGHNQTTIVGYNTKEQLLFFDRTNSGFVNFTGSWHSVINTTVTPENNTIQLRIFLDSCSVEIFANNGKVAMTNLIFPDPTQDAVEVYAIGGNITITSIDAWELDNIWPDAAEPIIEKKEEIFLPALERLNSLISS